MTERYYFERGLFERHRRYEECNWVIYDRKRGFQYPLGFAEDSANAQRIVDALNYHGGMKAYYENLYRLK